MDRSLDVGTHWRRRPSRLGSVPAKWSWPANGKSDVVGLTGALGRLRTRRVGRVCPCSLGRSPVSLGLLASALVLPGLLLSVALVASSPAGAATGTIPTSTAVTLTQVAGGWAGAPVVYSATVTAPSGGTPTGTVAFTFANNVEGNVYLCTETLSDGTGSCTSSGAAPTIDDNPVDRITATYSGDANFAGSVGGSSLSVNLNPVTTAASANPELVSLGDSVTYSTIVMSQGYPGESPGVPSASVTFSTGSTTLCTTSSWHNNGLAPNEGAASCSASSAPKGSDRVSVTYNGENSNFASSTTCTGVIVGLSELPGGIAAVQISTSNMETSNSSSQRFTLPKDVTDGDALVLAVGGMGTSATSVTGGGVTWKKAASEATGSPDPGTAEIWYGVDSTGGAGTTTVTLTGPSSEWGGTLFEFSGVANVDPRGTGARAYGDSATGEADVTAPPLTLRVPGELVVATSTTSTYELAGPAGSWIDVVGPTWYGQPRNGSAFEVFPAAGTSPAANWTQQPWSGATDPWAAAEIALKPAST
jgi:hypothetical protein